MLGELGVFNNVSDQLDRTQPRFGRRRLAGTLLGAALIPLLFLTLILIGTGQGFAETGEVPPDHPVSTSPTGLTQAGSGDRPLETAPSADDPPLTRAATQLRIDEMSPTRWLSRYGNVSIGQRE